MISIARALLIRSAAVALICVLALCTSPASAFSIDLNPSNAANRLRGAARALLTSADTGIKFPPLCNCDRNPRHSPFRLSYVPDRNGNVTVDKEVLNRFCFRVDNVGGCDPKLKCCNGKQGMHKIEFDVVDTCKPSLRRVTVDGLQRSFEFNTKLHVLRISQLGKTAATAPDTEVCLFLGAESECPRLQELCDSDDLPQCKYALFNQAPDLDCCPVGVTGMFNPPPSRPVARSPPPPRSAFPFCNCKRDPAASRYSTTAASNVTVVNGLTRICFDVNVAGTCAKPASPCCSFDLYKMEFEVDGACKGALAYTTVDGAHRAPFFDTTSTPQPAIKVTNINKKITAAAGTQVCLFLRPQCDTLEKLCAFHDGSCTVGLFNMPGQDKENCCPLSNVRL